MDISNLFHIRSLHLHNLQSHNYCHWQAASQLLPLFSATARLPLHLATSRSHCVAPDHHTAQPAFYTVPCCLVLTAVSRVTSLQGRGHIVHWPVTVAAAVTLVLLRHYLRGGVSCIAQIHHNIFIIYIYVYSL